MAAFLEPVADARFAARVFTEQWEELERRARAGAMGLLRLYRFCFQGACDLEHGSRGASDAPNGGCGAGELSMPVEAPSRTPYPPSGDSRTAQLRRRLRHDVAEPLRVPPYRPSGGGSGLAAAFASLGVELPDEDTAFVLLRSLWRAEDGQHPSGDCRSHLRGPADGLQSPRTGPCEGAGRRRHGKASARLRALHQGVGTPVRIRRRGGPGRNRALGDPVFWS
jgi:hypothetical protein